MTFLRWVSFLPAGILVGTAVQFIYPFMVGIGFETNNLMVMFAALLAGGATIYVSAWVAPTEHKLWVALPMVCISLFGLGLSVKYGSDIYASLITLLQSAGSIFVTVQIYRQEIVFDT